MNSFTVFGTVPFQAHLAYRIKWNSMDPRYGLQTAHSLQLLLVHGDTPFTLQLVTWQTSYTSGATETPSPDIIQVTLFLRCVFEGFNKSLICSVFFPEVYSCNIQCTFPQRCLFNDIHYFSIFFSHTFICISKNQMSRKKKTVTLLLHTSFPYLTCHTNII